MKNILLLINILFISIININAQCVFPTYNFYQYSCNLDCGLYLDNLTPDLEYNANVISWDFGDGTSIVDGFATQKQYTTPGEYTIVCTILDGVCAGMEYSIPFTVTDCNCPTEISHDFPEYDQTQCSSYFFNLTGDDFVFFGDQNSTLVWDLGDGTTQTTTNPNLYHAYENEGLYNVSCTFTNEFCTVTLLDTVDVEFCEEECVPFDYFFYSSTQNDCNEIQLVLDYNPNLLWYVDGIFVGQGYDVIIDLENGAHEICMELPAGLGCPYGSYSCTEINIGCDTDCPDQDDFYAYPIQEEECLLYQFGISTFYDGVSVDWDFGDGIQETTNNNVYHNYSEPGVYVVEAFYTSPDCPEGTNLTQTIIVENCQDCYLDVTYEIETCEYYHFSANAPQNMLVSWHYDGVEIGTGTSVDIGFPTEGEHVICAYGGTEFCTLQWCEVFDIDYEDCEEENCPTYSDLNIGMVDNTCNFWEFLIVNESEGDSVIWDFGDGTFQVGDESTTHFYEFGGVYTVTAEYYSNDCEDGVIFEYIVDVFCQEYCWVDAVVYQEDCTVFFEAYTQELDGFIEWYIDGIYYGSDYNIALEFDTDGIHYYCVSYYSSFCGFTTEYCGEFEVEGCQDDDPCPSEFDFTANLADQEDCMMWEFEIGEFENGASVYWDFGDGTIEYGDQYITHEYENAGVYIVSLAYTSPMCPDGFEMIYTIYVENCEIDCYLEIETIFQDCGNVTFLSLTNPEDQNAWISWLIDDEYIGDGEIIDYTFETEGWHSICVISESGICYMDYCTEIYIDLTGCDCYLEIDYDEVEDGLFDFTSTTANNEIITWDMGDGNTITGNDPNNYIFEFPGTYEVCASYTNDLCGTVEDCVTIDVEDENCTNVIITIEANVSPGQLELLEFLLISEGFEISGEFPLNSLSSSFQYEICLPNGCYDFVLFPADGLFDLIDLNVSATINGIQVASLENIIGTEEVVMVIPVNDTSCTSSIDSMSQIEFSIYPNPTSGLFTITSNDFTNNTQLEIYNTIGEIVYVKNISNNNEIIDVQSLSSGLYHVNIITENKLNSQKLLIEK